MKRITNWLKLYRVELISAALLVLMALLVFAATMTLFRKYAVKQNATVVAAAPVKQAEQGQALAADAVQQLDTAGRRDRLTVVIQQENARALQATQGADAPVDPQFLGALPRGLCKYAAYAADPGCADLRVVDPAKLP